MGYGHLAAIIVVALALGGLIGWALNAGTKALPRLAHRTVVIHADESYRGVLVGQYRDCFVLAHATLLGRDADLNLDGPVYVPRDKVSLIQESLPQS